MPNNGTKTITTMTTLTTLTTGRAATADNRLLQFVIPCMRSQRVYPVWLLKLLLNNKQNVEHR